MKQLKVAERLNVKVVSVNNHTKGVCVCVRVDHCLAIAADQLSLPCFSLSLCVS